jgi:hypothetical protein
MQIAELAHQAAPDLALVAAAPQGHGDHKQHQAQGRAQPDAPHFGVPRLTLLHTAFDHLSWVDLREQSHTHLLTDLVINRHLASSVQRKLLGVLFAGSMPDGSFLVFFSLLFALREMYWAQAPPLNPTLPQRELASQPRVCGKNKKAFYCFRVAYRMYNKSNLLYLSFLRYY